MSTKKNSGSDEDRTGKDADKSRDDLVKTAEKGIEDAKGRCPEVLSD